MSLLYYPAYLGEALDIAKSRIITGESRVDFMRSQNNGLSLAKFLSFEDAKKYEGLLAPKVLFGVRFAVPVPIPGDFVERSKPFALHDSLSEIAIDSRINDEYVAQIKRIAGEGMSIERYTI